MDPLRRNIIKALSLTGLATLTLGSPSVMARRHTGTSTTNLVATAKPLNIPSLDTGELVGGKRVFNLNIVGGQTAFFDGVATSTIGTNGAFLGTTLRASRGETVQFNITNTIGETTTVHWHGFHIPANMDGGPHQVIENGVTWQPEFAINQEATTAFYHAHTLHQTGQQVYRGHAGMFIFDDDNSNQLGLPTTYGVDDIPLIVQDRRFNDDGSFQYLTNMSDRMGMKGDTILVNGTVNPYVNVERRLIRFRILNGSNARVYNFGFSDGRTFHQIASDGGFLNEAVSMSRLRLSPAERAEILVDFQDGSEVSLQSYPDISGGMGGVQDTSTLTIVDFKPVTAQAASHTIPATLNNITRLGAADAQVTRSFVLGASAGTFTINGKAMDIDRTDEVVSLGATEIWEVTNTMPILHNFHVHGIQFQILSRNGQTPPANEQGWKDTVLVDSGEVVRIIAQFTDYADAGSPYMYHCHILEHEDNGMMGQFVVV